MDSVSTADSVFYLKLNQNQNVPKPDTVLFRENSLFNYPFLYSEKKNLFHHSGVGKNLAIHAGDFNIDSLKALTHEEYSRIIHDPNELMNPGYNPFDGNWFYYSIEDTTNAEYWTFTILHYKKETDVDLYLVYMKADGTYSDNLSVASFSEEDGFYEIPSRSRSSSRIISRSKMESDDYFESPNYEYEPDKRKNGQNFLATITHYHSNFTISEEGKIKWDTIITKEKKIYRNSEMVEGLFK